MLTRLSLQTLIGLLCFAVVASAAQADTRLSIAAMNGDLAAVRNLLAQGADMNAAQGDGTTALHWAAYQDNLEMTQLLLNSGADVKASTRLAEMTPLVMAARNGNAAIVETLLKGGADAGYASSIGTTALMLAAASGNAETVRVLLDNGADPNAKDVNQGQTALMFAAALNRVDAVRLLVSRGADVNALSLVPSPLGRAPRGENAQNAQNNNRRGGRGAANLALGGMTALQFAARDGHMQTVKALVESGADVNLPTASDKMSTLTLAILNGQFDIGKYLLENGADPKPASADGVTALFATIDAQWAARSWYPAPNVDNQNVGYLELMDLILEKGADVNAQMRGRLWMRIRGPGPEINGATAFWRAAQANDLTALRFLAERGADPNIPTTKGVTALTVAAGVGHSHQTANFMFEARLDTVRYLVEEHGAYVNASDDTGYTPLHGAALVGIRDLIMYLVARGGDVTARANTVAARSADDNDQSVAEGRGDTVADMANGPRETALVWPEIVELLENLGSENSDNCRASTCIQKPRKDTARPGQQ